MNTNSLNFNEFESAGREKWFEAAAAVLNGDTIEDRLSSKTPEGIKIQPIYDQTDLIGLGLHENRPGRAPFIRGAIATGHKVDGWWVAQDLLEENPVRYNELLADELMQGRNVVTLPLDSLTGETQGRRRGLSLGTSTSLQEALKGIDLQAAPLFVWAGPSALSLIGMIEAAVEGRKWRGAVLSDPLSESLLGELMVGVDDSLDEMAVVAKWATGCQRNVRTIGVQGHIWGDAGATAVEELAHTLATATEYLKSLVKRGFTVAQLAEQFVFSLSLGCDIFMQVAKLRAARLLWSKVIACFGCSPTSLFIHARSSCFNKSLLDQHSNILRSTAEGFAGVVGEANSMHLSPWDEVAGGSDPGARRLARNTQLLFLEECGLAEVADVAGGAWYVEKLTDQLARKAWEEFSKIEQSGGMRKMLTAGLPQQRVAKIADERLNQMALRRTKMVGVNLSPDVSAQFHQVEVTDLKPSVGNVVDPLGESDEILKGVDDIERAFRNGSTLSAVRKKLGRNGRKVKAIPPLSFPRASEGFENLRKQVSGHESATGERTVIWLAKFGLPKQWSARAEFSRSFFSIGGYEIRENVGGAPSIEKALHAAKAASPHVVVMCASDEDYEKLVPDFVSQLKHETPSTWVILAGNPKGRLEDYQGAGVDEFVHVRSECLAFLQKLNNQLGISVE